MTDPQASTTPASHPCRACGRPLEPGQDWCLECGAVVDERAQRLPGLRTTGAVAALTLALTGGAVAAAYAALTKPPAPPLAAQVVEVPGADTTPAVTTPAPTTPSTSTLPTVPPLKTSKLPKLPPLNIPQTPVTPLPAPAPLPAPTTTTTTTTTTPTTTTPAPAVTTLALKPTDASSYDPFGRITGAAPNRQNLFDDDPETAWTATGPGPDQALNFGLTIDLGRLRRLNELLISGTAAHVEFYATDSTDLPPDITDSRWAHVGRNLKSLDGDATIRFGSDGWKYRTLLIWFPGLPPAAGSVSISALTVKVAK